MKPPALQRGDTIGIMAPSSRVERAGVDMAVKALETLGYAVRVHPQTFSEQKQSAGTPEEKVKALHDLWLDTGVKAVMAARGGNRAAAMLPLIDYNMIAANPKILIGYSDATALLLGIQKMSGIVTFHGPMLNSLNNGTDDSDISNCFRLLSDMANTIPLDGARVVRAGAGEGRLIGGNLSLVCSLMGTDFEPDLNGAILFLEDCGDEISRFDRMFLQLRNAGVFRHISGLIIGEFTNIHDTGGLPFGFTLDDVVEEVTGGTSYPVLMNAPFGHGKKLATFPVGTHVELKANENGADIILI